VGAADFAVAVVDSECRVIAPARFGSLMAQSLHGVQTGIDARAAVMMFIDVFNE